MLFFFFIFDFGLERHWDGEWTGRDGTAFNSGLNGTMCRELGFVLFLCFILFLLIINL